MTKFIHQNIIPSPQKTWSGCFRPPPNLRYPEIAHSESREQGESGEYGQC